MVFNAGTHNNAFCVHYWDFAELAKPVVGAIGLLVPGRVGPGADALL